MTHFEMHQYRLGVNMALLMTVYLVLRPSINNKKAPSRFRQGRQPAPQRGGRPYCHPRRKTRCSADGHQSAGHERCRMRPQTEGTFAHHSNRDAHCVRRYGQHFQFTCRRSCRLPAQALQKRRNPGSHSRRAKGRFTHVHSHRAESSSVLPSQIYGRPRPGTNRRTFCPRTGSP